LRGDSLAVETTPNELNALVPAMRVDLDDPEVARARVEIEAQLFGVPLVPTRIGRFVVLERLGAGGMGIVYAAFDPQLDRKVAIKLLFDRGAAQTERGRLVAEAKAMAKLAHPNVVHVYEVGEHHGQLFFAMEHMRGRTLRRWCRESAPTMREILAACMQAGEGLAAAHAAGIVHRDFKPDNVLVDDDARGDAASRRVRVLDFGLARSIEEPTASDVDGIVERGGTPQTATRTGACVGTPGYVAPEQLRGATADHLADQFAFCVTTWEALVGTPPFVAADPEGLLDAVLNGRIRPPPRARMPAWVERVLRRGLSDVRDAPHRGRFPHLDELLRTLGRDPAVRFRRRIGLAGIAGGIVAAFAIGNTFRSEASAEPCSGAADLIDEAWPLEERDAALAGLADLDGAYGATIAPRLDAQADTFAQAWAAGHRDACLAHQRGEQSAELLDRRMVCLHRDRSAFAALGRITAGIAADALPQLVVAFAALPDPVLCGDLPALGAIDEPPPVEALVLADRLSEIQMLFAAGKHDAGLAASTEVIAEARRIGYRPFIAEGLAAHAFGVMERGDQRTGARELHEATTLALAVGDHRLALRAWASGAWAVATDPYKDAPVFDGRTLMTAIAERYADEPSAIVFYTRLGGMELANGRREKARAAYLRALAIGAGLEGVASDLALTKQGLALVTEDPVARDRLLAESIAGTTEKYGAEHPRTLSDAMIRAVNLDDSRAALAEVEPNCAAWHTFHPREKHDIAMCEHELAVLAELLGQDALAMAATDRWANAEEREPALARAMAALRHGDATAAATLLEPEVRALETERTIDAPFFVLLTIGEAELALGRAWRALADPRADEMLDRALADTERGAAGQVQPAVQRRLAHARLVIERG
jgi:predicted Ser/Thr protein kinase